MRIKSHLELTDDAIEQEFENFTLKPVLFSHEAHIRLAYIHIKKYGRAQAEKNMCEQIKGYAASLGATEKFNKTVTIASIKVVDHFMQKSKSTDFQGLIKEFPGIITDFRGLLLRHYGYNVFADKRAKQEYLEPDLVPFDN